jgi:uncharacterized protein YggE
MKKLIILAFLMLSISGAFAQSKERERTISVTGVAEAEVTPDIIDVSISLLEYTDGKTRVTIAALEKQLEKAVRDAGVPATDLTIDNVYSTSSDSYYKRKKTADFFASKQYNIRLHNLDKYNQILAGINPKGIESTEISNYDYSKMADVKRALKIEALLAAKGKATYLLEAIGEKLGQVVTIDEDSSSGYGYFRQSALSNSIMQSNAPQTSESNYKRIKLSFQVKAVFEIK